jgi:death-on-curing protein
MYYPSVADALEIYRRVMEQTGRLIGIRELGALESAIAQPRMTFNGEELYPTLAEKASALGFSLI